jgi:hypothetical protein
MKVAEYPLQCCAPIVFVYAIELSVENLVLAAMMAAAGRAPRPSSSAPPRASLSARLSLLFSFSRFLSLLSVLNFDVM